jgi:hypothetical protein
LKLLVENNGARETYKRIEFWRRKEERILEM